MVTIWEISRTGFKKIPAGRSVKSCLPCFLPAKKKELAQFVRDYEAGDIPADVPYSTLFRGQYIITPQADQPLTEIREGDLYFCLSSALSLCGAR